MTAPVPLIFSGRDNDLAELKILLKDPKNSIVAVHGMGGIGKSTLLKKLANALFEEKVFRAVLWSDINRQPDAHNLLHSWAYYADPNFTFQVSEGAPLDQKRFLLQQARRVKNLLDGVIKDKCEQCEAGRVLVVLDDVWEDGLEVVRLLLEACPTKTTVLITCRSYEVVIDLQAVSKPLNSLSDKDGVTLLEANQLPGSDQTLLSELVGRLKGHPLALTMAAKQVLRKSLPLTKLLEEYRTDLGTDTIFNKLKKPSSLEQNDELTMVFASSYEELSTEEQACFRGLGILAQDQPFDKYLLATLWEVSLEEAEEYCNRLIMLSLLETADNEKRLGEGWYRVHPLLQEYALVLLKENSNQ